eukprot:2807358-Prymnesium_polylepis.2
MLREHGCARARPARNTPRCADRGATAVPVRRDRSTRASCRCMRSSPTRGRRCTISLSIYPT